MNTDITKQTRFDYLPHSNVLIHLNTTEYYNNLSDIIKIKQVFHMLQNYLKTMILLTVLR